MMLRHNAQLRVRRRNTSVGNLLARVALADNTKLVNDVVTVCLEHVAISIKLVHVEPAPQVFTPGGSAVGFGKVFQ